jgi:hypothetical protein
MSPVRFGGSRLRLRIWSSELHGKLRALLAGSRSWSRPERGQAARAPAGGAPIAPIRQAQELSASPAGGSWPVTWRDPALGTKTDSEPESQRTVISRSSTAVTTPLRVTLPTFSTPRAPGRRPRPSSTSSGCDETRPAQVSPKTAGSIQDAPWWQSSVHPTARHGLRRRVLGRAPGRISRWLPLCRDAGTRGRVPYARIPVWPGRDTVPPRSEVRCVQDGPDAPAAPSVAK